MNMELGIGNVLLDSFNKELMYNVYIDGRKYLILNLLKDLGYFMLLFKTKDQDELVVKLVREHGPKNWSFIAKNLPGRIGKQCRERWHNHLNPDIKKDRWTDEEDLAIVEAHKKY